MRRPLLYRTHILFIIFVLLHITVSAQDYLKGKIEKDDNLIQEILYDRTQNLITRNVYQTVYKVMDKRKRQLYMITLTHDRTKALLYIAVREQGEVNADGISVKYSLSESGLIFSDKNNVDTAFSISAPYQYLLSFTDTLRDYPILHKISIADGKEIILDPLTKLRLKRHFEAVTKLLSNDPWLLHRLLGNKKDAFFEERLRAMADTFYRQMKLYETTVNTIQAEVESSIATLFKSKKVYNDARRYEGKKVKGEAEGTGLFMANGNYYFGNFTKGKFVSGYVLLYNEAYEYCGNYSKDSLNGIGRLKYQNGNYISGFFVDGNLKQGILFSAEEGGEVFLGTFNDNERTGYGEFQNSKGALFYGEFEKGRFVNGYAREIDPFGFYTFSKVEKGVKAVTNALAAEEFFKYINTRRAVNSN